MPGNAGMAPDERGILLGFLAQQRYVVRLAAYGLTDAEGEAAPTASSLTIGGLIKHLAAVERSWMDNVTQRVRERPGGSDRQESYANGFRMLDGETLESVLQDYEHAAAETDAIVASIPDLAQPVPVPAGVPWFRDIEAWSVRWVLAHLIAETARHAGHADIVRESIDGATAFPLMAAAEEWNVPWMEAWEPAPPVEGD